MASTSLQYWLADRSAALDEIESAHHSVGGRGPGRRYATQQINQAYAMLLSSQFQGFCRDLHTESLDHLVAAVRPAAYHSTLRTEFLLQRRLDRGNPNPGNLAADFNRPGIDLWAAASAAEARSPQRRLSLEDLNAWRNAIAHQDFAPTMLRLGRPMLQLAQVQAWRRACDGLARSFNDVLGHFIHRVTGAAPW
jgi:hypothetical protein